MTQPSQRMQYPNFSNQSPRFSRAKTDETPLPTPPSSAKSSGPDRRSPNFLSLSGPKASPSARDMFFLQGDQLKDDSLVSNRNLQSLLSVVGNEHYATQNTTTPFDRTKTSSMASLTNLVHPHSRTSDVVIVQHRACSPNPNEMLERSVSPSNGGEPSDSPQSIRSTRSNWSTSPQVFPPFRPTSPQSVPSNQSTSPHNELPNRSTTPPHRETSPPSLSSSPPNRSNTPPNRSHSPPNRSNTPPNRSHSPHNQSGLPRNIPSDRPISPQTIPRSTSPQNTSALLTLLPQNIPTVRSISPPARSASPENFPPDRSTSPYRDLDRTPSPSDLLQFSRSTSPINHPRSLVDLRDVNDQPKRVKMSQRTTVSEPNVPIQFMRTKAANKIALKTEDIVLTSLTAYIIDDKDQIIQCERKCGAESLLGFRFKENLNRSRIFRYCTCTSVTRGNKKAIDRFLVYQWESLSGKKMEARFPINWNHPLSQKTLYQECKVLRGMKSDPGAAQLLLETEEKIKKSKEKKKMSEVDFVQLDRSPSSSGLHSPVPQKKKKLLSVDSLLALAPIND